MSVIFNSLVFIVATVYILKLAVRYYVMMAKKSALDIIYAHGNW